ncbi:MULTISPECIES: hypothetical protein [Paenibacillus]|uniref:hypothetical protein n=1 Tax=Paenibacillus TaxID=44249 RepID=UPI0015C3FBD9|nr:hypothetical protein [Paenibacillus odorifer]
MNLVGHNIWLVEQLKIHMLKKLEGFNRDGFIAEGRFEELLENETKALDERLEAMKEWL